MDFILAMLPWQLLLGMRMRKTEKVGVAIAMSMGVLYVHHPSSFGRAAFFSISI